MIRQVMESADLALWPVAAILIFTGFTVLLVLWLFRQGADGFYRRMAGLALDEHAPTGAAPPAPQSGSCREGAIP